MLGLASLIAALDAASFDAVFPMRRERLGRNMRARRERQDPNGKLAAGVTLLYPKLLQGSWCNLASGSVCSIELLVQPGQWERFGRHGRENPTMC